MVDDRLGELGLAGFGRVAPLWLLRGCGCLNCHEVQQADDYDGDYVRSKPGDMSSEPVVDTQAVSRRCHGPDAAVELRAGAGHPQPANEGPSPRGQDATVAGQERAGPPVRVVVTGDPPQLTHAAARALLRLIRRSQRCEDRTG